MFDINIFSYTLAVMFLIAFVLWIVSRIKNDVGIVDSFWSLMILAAGICFLFFTEIPITDRHGVVILLLTLWALRLATHITRRNWGQEEDSRYQAIRKNNQPNFEFKSLYIVFLLQAFLAVIVALPLMSIFASGTEIHGLDYFAFALWLTGRPSAISNLKTLNHQTAIKTKCSIVVCGDIAGILITLANSASGGHFFCSHWLQVTGGASYHRY